MGFDYFSLGGEENEIEYIKKFKKLYSSSIKIPEGMEIFFKLIPDSEITHVWRGGKQGKFNLARAARIGWIKEVLIKQEKRIVKYIPKKRCIDFVAKVGKTCYVVRCIYEKQNRRYRFLTSFIKGRNVKSYNNYPDFDFSKTKSC
jgi:hypothetical protein